MSKDKFIVLLFGPPGSGKGTQANLLAEKTGLIHFDSGRYLEKLLHGTENLEGDLLQAKKDWDAGRLVNPEWITDIIFKKMEDIFKLGFGFASSGAPRTLYEAERNVPRLADLYGKKNIFSFLLKVPDEVSLKRNSDRLICSECGTPLLKEYYNGDPKNCPQCGGELYRRILDKPDIIKDRLLRYHAETEPIIGFLEKEGFNVKEVDGTPAPYKVFRQIYDHLKNA